MFTEYSNSRTRQGRILKGFTVLRTSVLPVILRLSSFTVINREEVFFAKKKNYPDRILWKNMIYSFFFANFWGTESNCCTHSCTYSVEFAKFSQLPSQLRVKCSDICKSTWSSTTRNSMSDIRAKLKSWAVSSLKLF